MAFRENLLHLRSANNMTQEAVAARIGVSRQAVTKWEAGTTSPEMDKLLALCDLFGCTLDDLVTGDLTGEGPTPALVQHRAPSDLFGYDKIMRTFGWKIPTGISLIILGVAFCVIFGGLSDVGILPEKISAGFGMLLLFAGIGSGLVFIIRTALEHSAFVKLHPYLEDFYTEADKVKAREQFTRELIISICLIFLWIVLVIFFGSETDETSMNDIFAAFSMLVCIAIDVWLIVHGALALGRVNIDEYNKESVKELSASDIERANLTEEQRERALALKQESRLAGPICGCIMIVATIIALSLLFIPLGNGSEVDEFFWLPWPIGGLLCGAATLILKACGKAE